MIAESMYDDLRFKFRDKPVTVITVDSLEKFSLQGRAYGPFEAEKEFDVPYWIAEVLLSQNKVRLKHVGIDLPDLQKSLWRETGEPDLQPLEPNFYFLVKQRIMHLASENLKSPNDVRVATQKKMEQLLRDLTTNRLLKLMKIALREERLRESKKKMTEEEHWLIERLFNLLRNWEKDVLGFESHD